MTKFTTGRNGPGSRACSKKDLTDSSVKTIVVGMHKALSESIVKGHSMNESPAGTTRAASRVYADLLGAQNERHKLVYVLASHEHFYMDGVFNTDYWRGHGGVLPGWIVGTAGAARLCVAATVLPTRTVR